MHNTKDGKLSPEEFQQASYIKIIELLTSIDSRLKTPPSKNNDDGWMDTQEILRKKKIGRSTLYNRIKDHTVLRRKMGGKNFYRLIEHGQKERAKMRVKR